jgi:UDP:flavonoid glycosyltransferase YjiC (YdhE family)
MSRARLVVTGGGATLVQSIVLGTPVVGVPLGAKDQPARIAGFEQLGAAIPAQCNPDAIRETVKGPLGDPETLRRLRANLSALETVNGLYPIVAAIGHALPNGPI